MNHVIIVVGAGLAGLSAAIVAAKNNYKVILVSPMPSERAQSVMAEGGINGALDTKDENDSIYDHYNDTMKAGVYLANPNAVMGLVKAAPNIVKSLAELGVVFNLDKNNCIDLRNFGGQKKKRTAFAMGSTGKQIMTAVIQETRKYEAEGLIIRYLEYSFVSIIRNIEGHCKGCIVINNRTEEFVPLQGDSVVIAAGGMNGLFGKTTGSIQNSGVVTAELFRQGISIANGEFIQYHPTTVECSGKRMLISEAARGEGGRIFVCRNGNPWYFLEERYPEMGNLMPRDVVSKEIWNLYNGQEGINKVFLDMTHIPEEVMERKLLDFAENCITYLHLDPRKEFIPVYPGIHYFMGGIYVDEQHRTSVKNLYAAGECCCQYHGANRLGGNSLLGAIYGGIVAAESCIKYMEDSSSSSEFTKCSMLAMKNVHERIVNLKGSSKHFSIPNIKKEMNNILNSSLGIVRNASQIEIALDNLNKLEINKVIGNYDYTCGLYENITLESLIILGKGILMGAHNRKESRGAHNRSDYPLQNDKIYGKNTVVRYFDKYISVSMEDIPKKRSGV